MVRLCPESLLNSELTSTRLTERTTCLVWWVVENDQGVDVQVPPVTFPVLAYDGTVTFTRHYFIYFFICVLIHFSQGLFFGSS